MFKKETISDYIGKMNATIAWYARFPVESLEICISHGDMKLGNIDNVSLPPIISCGKNCSECKNLCYDIKACMQYKNVMNARARNYSILKRNFDLYWNQLRSRLARKRTNKFFRFHVGGDIVSYEYLVEMIKTAKMFPEFRFWTYTKQYETVNDYVRKHGNSKRKAIPANLSIMFSEWRGLEMVNPFRFPVFRCVFRKTETPPKNVWRCPGNCGICIQKKRGCPYGESAWVFDH